MSSIVATHPGRLEVARSDHFVSFDHLSTGLGTDRCRKAEVAVLRVCWSGERGR